MVATRIKVMKKLFLFAAPFLFACGMEEPTVRIDFAAEELTVSKTALCQTMDASVREEMDAGKFEELCGYPAMCEDFETELICDGEWCVTHRYCRLN